MEYKYLGDKVTDPWNKNRLFNAIRKNGKCIRGKNGNMLVESRSGRRVVVIAKLLRKIKS